MSRLNSFLQGVRVIDLSQRLPGPMATLFLADMGAEVVKIEPPGGDELRSMGPRDQASRPLFFDALNAGKTTRSMDLTQADSRDEFVRLVETADILVESFRPGTMERLGVGAATLGAANPGLIYCALTGYGRGTPMAGAAGHDANYLALAGTLFHNGPGCRPFDPPVADCAGALFAVSAILGALHARARDGHGSAIEVALADVAMPLQLLHLAEYGATGAVPRPDRGLLNGGLACYRVYQTADARHMALAALEPKFWLAFCEAAGCPSWIPRQRDPVPQQALIAEVAGLFAALTQAACIERFRAADCCLSPVLDLAEAVGSPQHAARGLVRRSSSGAWEAAFPAVVDGEAPAARRSPR